MSELEALRLERAVANALEGDGPIVLAVSGGIDSMALLDGAARAVDRARLTVATFDHGTGAAATVAAALVERRSRRLGIVCVAGRTERMLASEAELRAARWSFLGATAAARGARIATAHTRDDQIETVLMRLMRGAGARGLAALRADGPVLRPWLGVTRGQIERYARRHRLRWVEDPTNRTPVFSRNRVRFDLLPALRRVDPSIDAALLEIGDAAAAWRGEVEALCDGLPGVRELSGAAGLRVPLAAFAADPEPAARLLWPALASRVGVVLDRRGIDRLATFTARSRVGSRMPVSGGWQVTRGRDALVLGRPASGATLGPFALSDGTRMGGWSFRVEGEPAVGGAREDAGEDAGEGAWRACLPANATLRVRPWRAGDAMALADGESRRKVKHLLSAARVTGHERAGWPVVLAGDEIVWIPGVRRGHAATARSGRPGLAFVCDYDYR